MEHRWGHRLAVEIAVHLSQTANPTPHQGRLTDVSLSGGFVSISARIRPLSKIQISFPTLLHPKYGTHLEAFVIRRDEQGVGIEWSEFSPPAIVALIRSIGPRPPVHGAQAKQAVRRANRTGVKKRRQAKDSARPSRSAPVVLTD
ncbi:MAG TPA: PilZ domain-containing protein [Steroidobacteraceae bacterium]|jgi:hypothetical protein